MNLELSASLLSTDHNDGKLKIRGVTPLFIVLPSAGAYGRRHTVNLEFSAALPSTDHSDGKLKIRGVTPASHCSRERRRGHSPNLEFPILTFNIRCGLQETQDSRYDPFSPYPFRQMQASISGPTCCVAMPSVAS